MKPNVGSIARVTIGLGLIGATLFELIGLWGWIGIVPVVTGTAGFCPAYSLLGLNSCRLKQK
jgi:hypothetical protein